MGVGELYYVLRGDLCNRGEVYYTYIILIPLIHLIQCLLDFI